MIFAFCVFRDSLLCAVFAFEEQSSRTRAILLIKIFFTFYFRVIDYFGLWWSVVHFAFAFAFEFCIFACAVCVCVPCASSFVFRCRHIRPYLHLLLFRSSCSVAVAELLAICWLLAAGWLAHLVSTALLTNSQIGTQSQQIKTSTKTFKKSRQCSGNRSGCCGVRKYTLRTLSVL